MKTAPAGRLSLRHWREEISQQVFDLVVGRIVHPSIDPDRPHRSYLVTNGVLEEEVSRAIDDMNRNWQLCGQPHLKLETIVRGQLLGMARNLDTSLWPSEFSAVQELLELYLTSGDEPFPKRTFCSLLEKTLPFEITSDASPSGPRCIRAISDAALICAIATSKFSLKQNYVAEVEAWTIYAAYVLALASKYHLDDKVWTQSFAIATAYVYNRLADLADELTSRTRLGEGHPIGDQFFIRARHTWLAALMSVLGLWQLRNVQAPADLAGFLRQFCHDAPPRLHLWGEAAVPQFLALYWYLRNVDATLAPDEFLYSLLTSVSASNHPGGTRTLADPYYGISELFPFVLGTVEAPLRDDFRGELYTLEALVHVYARRNWKRHMRSVWPDVTRVGFADFQHSAPWRWLLWKDEDAQFRIRQPQHTQDWSQLCEEASEFQGSTIPERAKRHALFVLLFLLVFPHRMTADVARWLDTQLVRA